MRDAPRDQSGVERRLSMWAWLVIVLVLVAALPIALILGVDLVLGPTGDGVGPIILAAAVALVLAVGLALGIGRRVVGSVRSLTDAARSSTGTGDAVAIPAGAPAEIADLAAAFNAMLGQRTEADAALREAEERYRTLIEGIPGIVYLDALGEVGTTHYISPQVEPILGYPPEDYLANDSLWRDRLHPADRERAIAGTREQERTGEPMTIEYRMLARDGRIVWLRDRSSLIREPGGAPRYVLGVMFDVTAEREIAAELAREAVDRQQVAEALVRMRGGGSVDATAASVVAAVSSHFGAPLAAVVRFTGPDAAEVLADHGPDGASQQARRLAPGLARRFHERATGGGWVEEAAELGSDDPWASIGLRYLACAPINTPNATLGVLVAGSSAPDATPERVSRRLSALAEFAAVAGQLLGPQLGELGQIESKRAEIRGVIGAGALRTVFQPVARLGDGTVVGYEALTRFDDGQRPDVRFGEATAAGVVHELEEACARAALAAAERLPPDRWLSVNMTPAALIADPKLLTMFSATPRPTVVEITEQFAVGDYAALRGALRRRPPGVELAVDDAGAGFASLRHILELGPRYVKLDMALVRGIAEDPARQALIAGMVHFASAVRCGLVAEGVETEAERGALIGLGVPYAQGFLIGAPAAAEALVGTGA